jgi:tetraacyldisaccharide 4'-kinase
VNLLSYALYPISMLYGAGIALRNLAYDKGWKKNYPMPVPVISVGNVTVGGTGKTPMAEFLLEKLQAMGRNPAYLSRGYGRSTRGYLRVNPADAEGLRYGDEALQVARRFPHLPVVVCEDRVAGVERLLAETEADVVVLDDAFQHRRIARDLDLVMLDASRLPWNDALLPSGRLREPLRSIHRAEAVVVSKLPAEGSQKVLDDILQRFGKDKEVAAFDLEMVEIRHFFEDETLDPPDLRACSGAAFSGLGNNNYFFAGVENLLGKCLKTFPFRDHHAYTKSDLEKILGILPTIEENKPKFDGPLILTTEKDFVRLKSMPWFDDLIGQPLYYIRVAMVPRYGWEGIEKRIEKILNTHGKYQ